MRGSWCTTWLRRKWRCEGLGEACRSAKLPGMRWFTFLALVGLSCRVDGLLAAGSAHVCAGQPQVTVHATEKPDAEAACEGASRALGFLGRAGIDGPPSATIEIVTRLPGELAGRAVGCYVRESRRIFLLSFEAFQAGGG